jgi:hypothetical protein
MIYTIDDIMRKLDSIESNIQTNKSNNELMTIIDVSRYSKLSDATIRRSIMRGTLKPFKEDGKKLFRRTDVDNWLKGL